MTKKWYNYFVSVDPAGGATGDPASTPGASAAQTVAEIASNLGQPPAFKAPVANPASFDEIYAAAEIVPPSHGYTIFKVAEMLQSEHIRNLPAGVKKSSILVALDASGVKLQEVIEDAVRRDRALDTFERVQEKSLEDLERRKNEESQEIQREMDRIVAEHRARIQANGDELAREKEKFYGWRLQKQQEEQKIADTVSYFVTENPITTAASQAAPPPKPKG